MVKYFFFVHIVPASQKSVVVFGFAHGCPLLTTHRPP